VALPQHECHIVLSVSPHGSQDQVFYTLQPLPYNIKVKIQIRIIKKKKKWSKSIQEWKTNPCEATKGSSPSATYDKRPNSS
jgi:hypothetical protein